MRHPAIQPAIDRSCLLEIADFVPRGSSVALLGSNDELARILTTTKRCALDEGRGTATVVIALDDGLVASSAFAQRAARATLAIVVTTKARPPGPEWHVIARRPVAALRGVIDESAIVRRLAATARSWPYRWLPPERWLLYRLQRVLASATRVEKLIRLAVVTRLEPSAAVREILVMGKSS